jgi:hypothetical protein
VAVERARLLLAVAGAQAVRRQAQRLAERAVMR